MPDMPEEPSISLLPPRNIHITDLPRYRLPPAGVVSILHRLSGLVLFLALPFLLWLFDRSLGSEVSFDAFRNAFVGGLGPLPGGLVKLVVLGLIWAYLHHALAGLRYLWMDATHSVSKEFGRVSALAVLAAGVVLTLALGAKLFGLY